MNPSMFSAGFELFAKLALQFFFAYMEAAGKTENEIRKAFAVEKEKFSEKKAVDLKIITTKEIAKVFLGEKK